MIKKSFSILIFSTILVACGDASETSGDATNNAQSAEQSQSGENSGNKDVVNPEANDAEINSRYNYEQDWEMIKAAIISKDAKTLKDFSTDDIDVESIFMSFSDEFLDILKKAKYEDLEVDDSGEEVILVFNGYLSGSDDEGNIYESGLYLYFYQGEPNLQLFNFLAAG